LEGVILNSRNSVEARLDRIECNWHCDLAVQAAIPIRLLRVRDILFQNGRKVMESVPLSPSEFDVLSTLRSSGRPYEMTPTQLASAVLLTSGGMTKTLKGLETKGYIERFCFETDRRSKFVRLTGAGRELIETLLPKVLENHTEMIQQALSDSEQAALNMLLSKLLTSLE
jgi:DNA-binding MarR family transcriptional regulator